LEHHVAGGSKTAVFAALAANLGIAIAKFGGAFYTGSTAMVAEGVHSLVDTGNQVLLLIGMKRAARPADARHPFGHSREIYFWSFVVAVLLFTAGGTFAIYEGIQKIRAPHPVDDPFVNYVILGLAILLEAGSFAVALKEFRKVAAGVSWWNAIRDAKDPVLFTVLFEDTAAMIGLIVALAGLVAAEVLQIPALDGAASIVIGLVLIAASLLLARETMSLIVGEAAAPAVLEDIERRIAAHPTVVAVREISSVHLGPHDIVVTAAVDFHDEVPAGEVERAVAALSAEVRAAQPDVRRIFLAPASFALPEAPPA
jgi:cation diffusion facilitator family transporter